MRISELQYRVHKIFENYPTIQKGNPSYIPQSVLNWTNAMKIFLLALIPLLSLPAVGQDFNLFEPIDVLNNDQPSQQRPGRESRVTSAKPEFTLVGTSQIGDRFSVMLADRQGEKIVVEIEPGTNMQIPEYAGYLIVSTATGKVSVQHPDSAPCIDYPDSGVRCNSAGNIAELTLPNNPPVRSSQTSAQAAVPEVQEQAVEEINEDPANPFAIMRARAQNGELNNPAANPVPGSNNRFIPRRIDPSEVPPGSRVVSTPFGDRLVPQ